VREALFFLTDLLSPFSERCPDTEVAEDQDWQLVTYLSGCYLVTPSLAHQLARCQLMELVPEEVATELRQIADNVTLRNQQFQSQLAEIVAAFDAVSLPYAVLKGGAYLVVPVYPTPFMRVMADLDLLVVQERLEEACGILAALGYGQVEDESLERKPALHRHSSPFVHDQRIAAVELHRAALPAHLDSCALASELLDSRRYHQFEGCGCYVLSPTFRVLNLIMHAEIVDYGYLNGLIPIRALEELAYTVRTDGTAIDWSLLAERFAAVDRLHVLLSFVLFAQRLFGVPLPSVLSHYSFMRPRLHHLRCVLQFESCIADRWIRRWYRLSETHLADRFGTGRSAREIRTKRLKLIAEGLRRRLDRE
jgi:hypothetical protein